MKEHNKETLKKAFGTLPQEAPTEQAWGQIAYGLKNEILRKSLASLPEEQAPLTFEEIEAKIKGKKTNYWFRLAAAILVVSLFSIYWFGQKSPTLASEKTRGMIVPKSDTEDTYQEILKICEQETWLCENVKLNDLKADFTELSDAQQAIKQGIENYGANVQMLKEFNAIERKKAELLNEMVEYI